jgi:hydroxymethylbilane synthase
LKLAATPKRADVRDVLVYRDDAWFSNPANHQQADWTPGQSALRGFKPHTQLKDFPPGVTIASSSTRRRAQLLVVRPDLKVVEIRGNVATRLLKVADRAELDGTVLALAGLARLNFTIAPDGRLHGDAVPDGLLASVLDVEVMLPCVGQAAIGIETRADDERINKLCERLNHFNTFQAVTAERAFLAGMGGGCQSPVAAYAEISGDTISMRAVSFRDGPARRAAAKAPIQEAAALGQKLAAELK